MAISHSDSATRAMEELQRCMETAPKYTKHEELFHLPTTEFSQLSVAATTLEPFVELWSLAADWLHWSDDWLHGELLRLHPPQMHEQLQTMHRTIARLRIELADSRTPSAVLAEIDSKLAHFELDMPLINALRNSGLRQRHWEQLQRMAGISFRPTLDMTLAKLLELYDFEPHLPVLQEIAAVASQEARIEHALDKMSTELGAQLLPLQKHVGTDATVLGDLDHIQALLESQQQTVHRDRDLHKSLGEAY